MSDGELARMGGSIGGFYGLPTVAHGHLDDATISTAYAPRIQTLPSPTGGPGG